VDMSGHRSRLVDAEMTQRADLVLGMERVHAREVVLVDPGAWERTYTLKEFVRLGEASGPRSKARGARQWISHVGTGRRAQDLAGPLPDDEVADPMNGTREDFAATGAEIYDLVLRLVALIEPST